MKELFCLFFKERVQESVKESEEKRRMLENIPTATNRKKPQRSLYYTEFPFVHEGVEKTTAFWNN